MAEPTLPPTEVPNSGAFRVRVRYCECDPMGVAHHSAYMPWFEEARTELLRAAGVSYAQLEAEGVLLAVVKLETTYRRPARYDDVLEVRVRVVGGSRVKIRHEYEVVLAERGRATAAELDALRLHGEDVLARAATTLACIDAGGRPRALPDWLVPRP
jgi:acyl-CoA thioester hydrolase